MEYEQFRQQNPDSSSDEPSAQSALESAASYVAASTAANSEDHGSSAAFTASFTAILSWAEAARMIREEGDFPFLGYKSTGHLKSNCRRIHQSPRFRFIQDSDFLVKNERDFLRGGIAENKSDATATQFKPVFGGINCGRRDPFQVKPQIKCTVFFRLRDHNICR